MLLFLLQNISMSRKNVNFEDKKKMKKRLLEKQKSTKIDDIDANKILVSK